MISHLFFGDDSLVFFKATDENCSIVKSCLSRYERTSGQLVNYDKSAVTFSETTPQSARDNIKVVLSLRSC